MTKKQAIQTIRATFQFGFVDSEDKIHKTTNICLLMQAGRHWFACIADAGKIQPLIAFGERVAKSNNPFALINIKNELEKEIRKLNSINDDRKFIIINRSNNFLKRILDINVSPASIIKMIAA